MAPQVKSCISVLGSDRFFNLFYRYSYDYGLVHYIMMSTEHNFEPGSRQYMWLENDLKKIDRKKTPWVILGGHRAMYASAMIWCE